MIKKCIRNHNGYITIQYHTPCEMMDAFAGVLADIILGGLSETDVDALVDVSVNVFAGVTTVGFVISAPLERFSC